MIGVSLLDLPRDMLKEIAMIEFSAYFGLAQCNKYLKTICDEIKEKAKKTLPIKHVQNIAPNDLTSFRSATSLRYLFWLHYYNTPLPITLPTSIEFTTINDLKEGVLRGFKDDKLILLIDYKNDILNGNYKWFYQGSTQLLFETYIKDTRLHGKFKSYHEDGKVHWEGEYDNGRS